MCEKTTYRTKNKAIKDLSRLNNENRKFRYFRKTLTACYRCAECDRWHLTTQAKD